MDETRGVFGLTDAVEIKAEGNWVPLDQVWNITNPGGSPVRFSDGAGPSPNTA